MPKRKNYSNTVSVRLSDEMAIQARREAERQKRPLAEVMRDLLRDWLAGQAAPAPK
jgi:hypothetical protein